MEPKNGDRVSLDTKKVGQPRRAGVVRSVTHGISGIRYEIAWDDGSASVIAPGAGVLLVEGRSSRSSTSKRPKPKTNAKSKSKAPKAKKSGSKAKTGKRR
jgi:hypothetical protein